MPSGKMMQRISRAYNQSMSSGQVMMTVFTFAMVGLLITTLYEVSGSGLVDEFGHEVRGVRAVTWNIAAINNNPFEYWITWDNEKYVQLMQDVSEAMKSPGDRDVPVSEVFTDAMFSDLKGKMETHGWAGVDQVASMWENDYKNRKIISEFIKDGTLGKKRLASMPDRVTNTIVQANGAASAYRPTVINCYDGDLGTQDKWWGQWKEFVFDSSVTTLDKAGSPETKRVTSLFQPILKAKYPTVTEEEERISIPLQTLCAAIFDATLVHLLNSFKSTPWQPIRKEMCEKLNMKKNSRTLEILSDEYRTADLMFLQEVGKGFIDEYRTHPSMSRAYDLRMAESASTSRDQNSLILLKRGEYTFKKDVTDEVMALVDAGTKLPVANGDLVVIQVQRDSDGAKFLMASFHGDTNGLATIPIVTLVHNFATSKMTDHKLLFGMDANTYAHADADQQDVTEFAKFYSSLKLNSDKGKTPDPENFTTFHARTYLQPQLNKAVAYEERDVKGDKNPKDFIVFFESDFRVLQTKKDNTGRHVYVEDMVFPTLEFPSDHGISSTVLAER